MERLGRNVKGYAGERLDVASLIGRMRAAADAHGWRCDALDPDATLTQPVMVRVPAGDAGAGNVPRVYLSAGIHGDEPAGPLAMCRLIEDNAWPANMALWMCPLLNPAGFSLNRRENAQGIDLNRDYLHLQSEEVRSHIAWLEQQPTFDLALCLHEDWESHGFYLYELNPDQRPSLAQQIIQSVSKVCPIDQSPEIEGRPASGGIIRPSSDPLSRPQWPEAFWLMRHKARLSYTLEAPSDWPLEVRVGALMKAVKAVLGS